MGKPSIYLQKYPLPEGEKRALMKTTLLSELLILAVAVVLIGITVGADTGDWAYALISGWRESILWALGPGGSDGSVGAIVPPAAPVAGASATAAPGADAPGSTAPGTSGISAQAAFGMGGYLLRAALGGVAVAAIMLALLLVLDALGKRFSKSYEERVLALRQGIMGELIRLPMWFIVPAMMLAGFCEELCFRFVLLNLAIALFALVLPVQGAQVVALIVVSIAFWLVHEQYRDPFSSSVVIAGGLVLGASYLLTGWILVPMFGHALYNIGEIVIERRQMRKESDYFGGKPPMDFITSMGKKEEFSEGQAGIEG